MNWRSIHTLVLAACTALLSFQAAAQRGFGFGFGGGGEDIQLVERYDRDGDGYLNQEERDAYRFGESGRRAAVSASVPPSERLTTRDVRTYGDETLYDPDVLRTLFIEFPVDDWENELETFYGSDVDVPAKLTVDGRDYPGVGIHFRGNTSFRNIPRGLKRGLNLSVDFIDDEQRLLGYRTLNLLNGYNDETFLRQVMYLHIANQYYPAPKANFVRVVINGEDWGVYVSVQQFNSDFTREAHDTNEARWRIQGSFSSRGGLEYLGDSVSAYQREYKIKNKDTPENWEALIELTRVLNRTPPAELVAALDPIFDIDEALRFLAVDNALQNTDGYWERNSDYSLYRDEEGRFHVTAYDTNETMQEAMSFRGFGSAAGGARLDPLEGSRDGSKPLLYRLLMVPELEQRYLGYVRDVAENWLDWEQFEAVAGRYRAQIADIVIADDRKLYSSAEFDLAYDGRAPSGTSLTRRSRSMTLKDFVQQRQAFLLDWLAANGA